MFSSTTAAKTETDMKWIVLYAPAAANSRVELCISTKAAVSI